MSSWFGCMAHRPTKHLIYQPQLHPLGMTLCYNIIPISFTSGFINMWSPIMYFPSAILYNMVFWKIVLYACGEVWQMNVMNQILIIFFKCFNVTCYTCYVLCIHVAFCLYKDKHRIDVFIIIKYIFHVSSGDFFTPTVWSCLSVSQKGQVVLLRSNFLPSRHL